jgi:hypothetical protein
MAVSECDLLAKLIHVVWLRPSFDFSNLTLRVSRNINHFINQTFLENIR